MYLLHGNTGDRSLMRPPGECMFSCRKDENQKKYEKNRVMFFHSGDVAQALCNTARHLWPSTVRLFHRRGLNSCNESVMCPKISFIMF